MRRFVSVMVVFLWLLLPIEAFAKEKGRGIGSGHSETTRSERAGQKVSEEVIDAVADELAGTPEPAAEGLPPGLAKKEKLPPGLAKKGKIPPGWEKGKKEGWDNSASATQESGIRRAIRGIFRRTKESPPEK